VAKRGDAPTPQADASDARWRERAVERSLRSARDRAVSRSDRFMAAATELLRETNRTDFTVQEIVERSRMSLRSFYQHFASKDDLLLALFEEAIRTMIERLRMQVDRYEDPLDRLRAFVVGLYESTGEGPTGVSRAFTVYHLRLAESHPTEFTHAVSPQMDLLVEIVEAGVATGQFRSDLPAPVLADILMQTIVSALQNKVLGISMTGVPITGDALWQYCLGGVGAPPQSRRVRA